MIFTGRNEVVGKVMFLQVCVCPQGGGCLPQCMLGCHTPGPGRHPLPLPPWDQGDPPGPGRPLWTRQTPWYQWDTPQTRQTPPQDQGDTPQTRQSPQDQGDTPLDQADPPLPVLGRPLGTRETPPGPGRPPHLGPGRHPPDQAEPPGKQTPAYGLRAAGTHHTGMHSCLSCGLHMQDNVMGICAWRLFINTVSKSVVFSYWFIISRKTQSEWLEFPRGGDFRIKSHFTTIKKQTNPTRLPNNELALRQLLDHPQTK